MTKDTGDIPQPESTKTMGNTSLSKAKQNVSDIQFFGNGDTFKLISKAWSEQEGWMKSTKAMHIDGVGCVIQVTTQQKNPDGSYSIAEALTFVPNCSITEAVDDAGSVFSRSIVRQ